MSDMLEFSPEIAMLRLFTRNRETLQTNEELCDSITLEPQIALIYKNLKDYYQEYSNHNYVSKSEFSNGEVSSDMGLTFNNSIKASSTASCTRP